MKKIIVFGLAFLFLMSFVFASNNEIAKTMVSENLDNEKDLRFQEKVEEINRIESKVSVQDRIKNLFIKSDAPLLAVSKEVPVSTEVVKSEPAKKTFQERVRAWWGGFRK